MGIHTRSSKKGFSLIELIAVIAILAITLFIGVPALGNAVEKQRLRSTTVEFVSAVRLARQEAINRNTTITICPSTDGLSCTANTWTDGWLVFIDKPPADLTREIVLGRLLLVKKIENSSLKIDANSTLQTSISYEASGRNSHNGTIILSTDSNYQAEIILNNLGRPKVVFSESS